MINSSALPASYRAIPSSVLNLVISDWLIAIKPVNIDVIAQPSYVLVEISMFLITVITLIHVLYLRGRWIYTWLASLINGSIISLASVTVAVLENHWHAQSLFMIFSRRLPLHVLLMYPSLHHAIHYSIAHLRLPRYAQALSAGLLDLLLSVPYHLISARFIHRTWHETEPLLLNRLCQVPCTSFLFQLVFGASFFFSLQLWRRVITSNDSVNIHGSARSELVAAMLGGVSGPLVGLFLFVLTLQPPSRLLISQSTLLITLTLSFALMVWSCDRLAIEGSRKTPDHKQSQILICTVFIIYCVTFVAIALFLSPENESSTGYHHQIGPCDVLEESQISFGPKTIRRKYMCTSDHNRRYYNFDCLAENSTNLAHGTRWYKICGTSSENSNEFVVVLLLFIFTILHIFHQLLYRSGPSVQPCRNKLKSF